MACTASKTPLFRSVAARGYSVCAQGASNPRSLDVQQTVLPNKMVVATAEPDSPVSRISILFKAGSRNETYDNLGVSHAIRNAAGLSTQCSTGFGITRTVQHAGGSFSCTSDRETVAYSLELTRDHLEAGLKVLQNAVCNQVFKPWEISDNFPRIKVDLANVSPQVRAVELLHKACYHTGLGNSMFMAKHQIGKLSPETLQHYFTTHFASNRAAVVGIGIDHQMLVGFSQCLPLESCQSNDSVSTYSGPAEMRKEKGGKYAHVAIATQGAPLQNTKEALAFAILQAAAGNGSSLKRGEPHGTYEKAVASVSKNAAVRALNCSYTDNGLFGFVLSAEGKQAGKAIEAALGALKSGNISNEDIARGKMQLKTSILYDSESNSRLVEDMGLQALLLGNVRSTSALIAEIDAISSADVTNAAKKVASGKLSIGAVGNLETVPYINKLN